MKLRLPLAALALLLAVALPACGGGDPGALTDEGYTALSTGDYVTAQKKLADALAQMEPSDPRYLEAKVGYLRAKAYTDGPGTKAEFLAMAQASPVGAKQYNAVVADLASAGNFEEAVALLEAGQKAYPDDPKWPELIQAVGKKAESAGASEALKSLKGMGYIGD